MAPISRLHSISKLQWGSGWIVSIILLFFVFTIHGSALYGNWRWDDAGHLLKALEYSPLEYFFIPKIMGAVSGYQITPWNIFVYDINLYLFGLRPFWFYLHHLLSLWLASVATYILLRNWYGQIQSFFGASLFLIGPPVFTVAQQLMTGHYIYGLFFSSIMLHLYILSLRKQSIMFSFFSAIFYLFAVSCKEVYVPFILLFPFFSDNLKLSRYAKYLLFHIVILTGYSLWRYLILGSLRGPLFKSSAIKFNIILGSIKSIFFTLFGNSIISWLLMISLLALLIGFLCNHKMNKFFLIVSALVMFLPIYPFVISGINWMESGRYLFAFWWLVCIIIVTILSIYKKNRSLYVFISLVLAISVGIQSSKQARYEKKINLIFDAHYDMAVNARPPLLIYAEPAFFWPDYFMMGLWDYQSLLKKLGIKYNDYWPFLFWTPKDNEIDKIAVWDNESLCFKRVSEFSKIKKEQFIAQMKLIGEPKLAIFNILPLPLIEQKNGFVDNVNQLGNKIEIKGRLPHSRYVKKMVFLISPISPKNFTISSFHKSSAEISDYNSSDFLISMDFENEMEAKRAASSFCVASMGFEKERKVLSLFNNLPTYCDGFLK